MSSFVRVLGRQCVRQNVSVMMQRRCTLATKRATAFEEMNNYWVKNRNLGRPISPHLTVYKPHLSMVISITNRVAAVAQQVALCGGSIALMCLPGNYKTYLDKIRHLSLGPVIIYSFKFLLAVPFVYHFLAGLRHLAWDAGFGFSKTVSYKSGWLVVAATLVLSTALVFGVKPSMTT